MDVISPVALSRFLPPGYRERQDIEILASPSRARPQRQWILEVGRRFIALGGELVVTGVRDALWVARELVVECPSSVTVMDHGYFRSAFPADTRFVALSPTWLVGNQGPLQTALSVSAVGRRLVVCLDSLGEDPAPEMWLQRILSAAHCDAALLVLPDRMTQHNREPLGPPKAAFRLREWTAVELAAWASALGLAVDHIGTAPLSGRQRRRDAVVLASNPSAGPAVELAQFVAEAIGRPAPALPDDDYDVPPGPDFTPFEGEPRRRRDVGIDVTVDELESLLMARLEDRVPFSVARMGHSETKILGWPEFLGPVFPLRGLRSGAGQQQLTAASLAVRQDVAAGLQDADVVGMPDETSHDRVWRLAMRAGEARGVSWSGKTLTSQNVHLDLLKTGALDRLIRASSGAVFVGSRDLRQVAEDRFKGGFFEFVRLPGQARLDPDAKAEWLRTSSLESVYQALADSTQHLVLVGAGLHSKRLARIARQRGAVVIDIGSVMDVWAGIPTRSAFQADFLREHAWMEPAAP